ncbi:uncharacterized protein [Musca autumnalis]|uniref:uncharacterized protein n=1 Tax=Musca autumnalis TaxID=221902 RepID=UPI003CFA8D80
MDQHTCSYSLPMLDSSEIGRNSDMSSLFGFFLIGSIFADFQADGKYPLLIHWLNIQLSSLIVESGNFLMMKICKMICIFIMQRGKHIVKRINASWDRFHAV